MLFRSTGDIRALDVIIRLADKCVPRSVYLASLLIFRSILALRNDPETGLEMWSGNRELVRLSSSTLRERGADNFAGLAHDTFGAQQRQRTPLRWL